MESVAAMETVEGRKRMKLLKSVNDGKLDRISALPDCLLLEILSRLPTTEYAVRTGSLSKRWKNLWTSVTTLKFKDFDYLRSQDPKKWFSHRHSMSDFVSFVEKTLTQCRQLKLMKFVLYTEYDRRFKLNFQNWIRYAISRNVEELDLEAREFELDEFFFTTSCFTDLKLRNCILKPKPSAAISWKNLRTLCIRRMKLDEDSMENILSGSPLLETLELVYCYDIWRIDVTSKSVKNLVFSGYKDYEGLLYGEEIIEINAPNILSLTIRGELFLGKLLLVNVASVVKANLNYEKVKKTNPEEEEEEMLKRLILNLSHARELEIGKNCSKVLFRLEAKSFAFPSNVKFPDCSTQDRDSVKRVEKLQRLIRKFRYGESDESADSNE